jgi:hypothetical protein
LKLDLLATSLGLILFAMQRNPPPATFPHLPRLLRTLTLFLYLLVTRPQASIFLDVLFCQFKQLLLEIDTVRARKLYNTEQQELKQDEKRFSSR